MQRLKTKVDRLAVLFIGRRVSLLNSFRQAARQLKLPSDFLGTEATNLSPALQLCDRQFLVKPVTHAQYVRQLLAIVKANNVRLLVPTVDLDLKLLAHKRAQFARLGCFVLISTPRVIDICQDKRKTYRFLVKNGFDTPRTMSIRTALSNKKLQWPCFLKPWDGYASRGNAIVSNRRELSFFAKKVPNPICQELVNGAEFAMKVRCVVPRKRIQVRAGEVSKGKVVKHPIIMAQAKKLVEKLGAGPGVVTLQLFLTPRNKVKFIEINPRFGGGAPLSIKAGANFPKWILQELLGKRPNIRFDGFKDDLVMLRYDAEVWMQNH
ncbi:MAG: ATP-grasp domain-containing protein [Planctomycetota bacterium]|jgi:carbamoyl-phosphate synthase large subunit